MDELGEDVFAKGKWWNGFYGPEAVQSCPLGEAGVEIANELILTFLQDI